MFSGRLGSLIPPSATRSNTPGYRGTGQTTRKGFTVEYVYVNAMNDPSGNPRRGWIAYQDGAIVGFYDEGYNGSNAVPSADRSRIGWEPLYIKPGQYRALCKLGRPQ